MLNFGVIFSPRFVISQVYGRFEGFEQRLESVFGPKGSFSGKNVKDKVTKMKWRRDVTDGNWITSDHDDVIDNNFDNPKVKIHTAYTQCH